VKKLEDKMAFCSNCGVEIVEGVKFCSSCGKAIGGVSNASAVPYDHTNETEDKNKIKNGLLLCGAILGAIFGAVVAIASITSGNFGGYTTIWVSCGIGAIVFGIILCVPNLRKNLFLIIAEIAIIIGILTNSLSFVNQQSWFSSYRITGIEALIAFSIIIPLILLAGLIVPYKEIVNEKTSSLNESIESGADFIVTDEKRLWESPSFSATIEAYLQKGTKIKILSEHDDSGTKWLYVETTDGKKGYCMNDDIKTV
jgi:hypothetical protein